MKLTIQYEFRSQRANISVPSGYEDSTIFLDWGDRNEGHVFDHQHLDPNGSALCITALVNSSDGRTRIQAIYNAIAPFGKKLLVVTHERPDLDSVAAAYCVEQMASGSYNGLTPALIEYIQAIDQGSDLGEDLSLSAALLFRLIRARCKSDEEVMKEGQKFIQVIDAGIRTSQFRPGWTDPRSLPGLLADAEQLRSRIPEEIQAAQNLLSSAPRILASVPLAAPNAKRQFSWVDGLALDLTSAYDSVLGLRDQVRLSRRSSLQGRGYGLIVTKNRRIPLDSFSVSLEPDTRASLLTLGNALDIAESKSTQSKSPGSTPCVPRAGYSSQQPWYDGRTRSYTHVQAPDSGSTMDPLEVLQVVLTTHDPLWQEGLDFHNCGLKLLHARGVAAPPVSEWLYSTALHWDGHTVRQNQGRQLLLADALNTLATQTSEHRQRRQQFSAYLPLLSCPAQLLPAEGENLHLHLALYLALHGLPANSPQYPRIEMLTRWSELFTWEPIGGAFCGLSELGILLIDTLGTRTEVRGGQERLESDYFDLVRQLSWTDDLSEPVRKKKRYEALCDFARYCAANSGGLA